MKKCILSAIAGALSMLFILYGIAAFKASRKPEKYEHIDYVSELLQEDCYICANGGDCSYWGEDNVGLLDLNTVALMYVQIQRYDDQGNLVENGADYMQTSYLIGDDTYACARSFPKNGYAHVQITGVRYAIDRESVQSHLCQSCLDSINDLWFTDRPPAEYAVVSFEDRTIQPLLNSHPWFASGNYGVDCEFKDDGEIDLLIHWLS